MTETKNNKILKYACYLTNVSMAAVLNIVPLLFIPLRTMYGLSYTMLGLLVVIGFLTQLFIDLVFSFYADKFNVQKAIRLNPILAVSGVLFFVLAPVMFKNSVYTGLVIGTVIFSAAGGLSEVLISPIIAALPSENPEREMSKLHSTYAWGAVFVILISAFCLHFFGAEKWQWIFGAWIILPILSAVCYFSSTVPHIPSSTEGKGTISLLKNRKFLYCFLGIFMGGAAECTMSQWASGYIEKALGIEKVWGDVLGVAMFAFALGLGRSLYAKYGKNIYRVLFFGTLGASLCYLTAVVSDVPAVGLASCVLTGFCVSMLWPGSIVAASDGFPQAGVIAFALMAAGGDLGASVGPQLVGAVTDTVMKSSAAASFAQSLNMPVEQLSMKLGLLAASAFPIIGIYIFGKMMKEKKKQD